MLTAAVAGCFFSFAVESSYSAQAQEVQFVRIDKTQHSPFGPVTVEVGKPVMLLVDDPSAFMKNKTATGLPMLDADYANQHGGAALQLESVESVVRIARLGCLLSAVIAAVGLLLIKRFHGFFIPPEA